MLLDPRIRVGPAGKRWIDSLAREKKNVIDKRIECMECMHSSVPSSSDGKPYTVDYLLLWNKLYVWAFGSRIGQCI
jgi:hypothetical protein